MLIAFSGDPYLARREAFKEARLRGLPERLLPPEPEALAALVQPGLFGREGGVLDFRELSEAGWQELKQSLEAFPADLLIYDPKPPSGRTRFYKKRGEVRRFPTPRFGERRVFVQNLLKARGLKAPAAVVHLLAESEADTEGLVREVEKLALLEGPLTPERVGPLLAWSPAQSAFDLAEPLSRREPGEALAVLARLLAEGEAPLKVLGALAWHYGKLAATGWVLESRPKPSEAELAKALGVAPFAARRLLAQYRRLGAHRVERALGLIVEAELRAKTGGDPKAHLVALVYRLARLSG